LSKLYLFVICIIQADDEDDDDDDQCLEEQLGFYGIVGASSVNSSKGDQPQIQSRRRPSFSTNVHPVLSTSYSSTAGVGGGGPTGTTATATLNPTSSKFAQLLGFSLFGSGGGGEICPPHNMGHLSQQEHDEEEGNHHEEEEEEEERRRTSHRLSNPLEPSYFQVKRNLAL
jgi:hypothetical protein